MTTDKLKYPLPEQIGDPYLFVGRKYEFENFNKWIANIPKRLSKSRVILARRKSGKTAFVQRIFNNLWHENGLVIPFYINISEQKIWYPDFAVKYFCTFATQYISFIERDETLVDKILELEKIKLYGEKNNHELLVEDVEAIIKNRQGGWHGLVWSTAYEAPHRYAAILNIRFLVIIDEFQNLTEYIYRDEACKEARDETMPGSFHHVVESKLAPMLVTGSYMGWLIKITSKYLQAGRLARWRMTPYLQTEEGLEAVYRYATALNEPINNHTATLINQLCMSDPFFISCVMQSQFPNKNLSTPQGVIDAVNYEVTDRESFLAITWAEYIQQTVEEINDRHAKDILLCLSQQSDRYWTPQQLKDYLNLTLSAKDIRRRLLLLSEADLIERGNSDIQFRGLQDGTLNLILRNRFQEEVKGFAPDLSKEFNQEIAALKADNQKLRGHLSNLSGRLAEHIVATEFRSRKRFKPSLFFEGFADDSELNIINVQERLIIQRTDGKTLEIDIKATTKDNKVLLVEVKSRKTKATLKMIEDFEEKVTIYQSQNAHQTILAAFLSLGGFESKAKTYCQHHNIATAQQIEWYFS